MTESDFFTTITSGTEKETHSGDGDTHGKTEHDEHPDHHEGGNNPTEVKETVMKENLRNVAGWVLAIAATVIFAGGTARANFDTTKLTSEFAIGGEYRSDLTNSGVSGNFGVTRYPNTATPFRITRSKNNPTSETVSTTQSTTLGQKDRTLRNSGTTKTILTFTGNDQLSSLTSFSGSYGSTGLADLTLPTKFNTIPFTATQGNYTV